MTQCPEEIVVTKDFNSYSYCIQCKKDKGHKGYHWHSPTDDGESWEMFWLKSHKINSVFN